MEDLTEIENQLLQSEDENQLMDTSESQVSEKSEEKPQLDATGQVPDSTNDVLPDKKNDEKSKVINADQNGSQPSAPPSTTIVKTELMDMNTSNSGAAVAEKSTDPTESAAPPGDATMDPVVLGTYTEKDLTVKDPTETESNTKDLFKGTIQLLRQILGIDFIKLL